MDDMAYKYQSFGIIPACCCCRRLFLHRPVTKLHLYSQQKLKGNSLNSKILGKSVRPWILFSPVISKHTQEHIKCTSWSGTFMGQFHFDLTICSQAPEPSAIRSTLRYLIEMPPDTAHDAEKETQQFTLENKQIRNKFMRKRFRNK